MAFRDLILGRPNPWERLYDPSRKSLKSAAEYLKENVNVAKQYLDYVSPGEVGSVDEIRPGHGAVIRQGLTKLAVYRDDLGALHPRSAVCRGSSLGNWRAGRRDEIRSRAT